MDLRPYVENLRHELAVAADAGGDEARALAGRLTAPLESAARLTLLNALSDAMDEVTRDLAPGSVSVRLRGLDPEFVVNVPETEPAYDERPAAPAAAPPVPVLPETDEGGTARINLRLPAHLKARAEEAAVREGISVNSWVVRALSAALSGAAAEQQPAGLRRTRTGQSYTGWVR
ncbi:toxin-antitoxin system HicB family antitoxin [Streptomyces racemochromogenes]|uniref:Toxin-antitoxin system HicB family antitoxin n=1 Tax=Streptomyces racemochromogenes TaxID=67353 RepID=A0ABW7PN85_9ACTN